MTDTPWAIDTRQVPASITVLEGGIDERAAWQLFDEKAGAVLETHGRRARIEIALSQPTFVDAIAVFGAADGTLGVEARGPDGRADLLRDASLARGEKRWNRHDITKAPLATSLTLIWQPSRPDAVLREVEIWGRPRSKPSEVVMAPLPDALYTGVPEGARVARAGQGEQIVSLATGSGATAAGGFTLPLEVEPRAIDRAFLVYDLKGLSHFTAAPRAINGQRALGKFGVSRGAKGGLQVEEIAPAWLQKGTNRIQFMPLDGSDPGSYRISDLRLVFMLRVETRVAEATARAWGALRDGREGTGWRASAGKPGEKREWLFATATQPWALDVRLPNKGVGTLTIAATEGGGQGIVRVNLDQLSAGWHRVPLKGLPVTEKLAFTLDAGKEQEASISELLVEGSALPVDQAPRIVVSYPLSGECVNHRVHVRGFVVPADASGLEVNGAPARGALSSDGAFAVDMSEQQVAGRPIVVEAIYANGTRSRRSVAVGGCVDRPPVVVGDDGRKRQPAEDTGAPYGVTVKAGQPATLSFGGAKLDIPAGAVDKDVRITVRPLPSKDVAPMDPGMTNISPAAQAYRFGPLGMVFKKPIRMTLAYDKALIPAGHSENDVRTFYYAEELHRWEQVGIVGQNAGEMTAVTEHFTDFINATLAMPEHPGTQSLNPTSLKDIKLADPAAGMTFIEPPTPNSMGTANLTFPITVPPGRRGIQPSLAITYSSERGNGWLGVGWDVPISHIEIDTRFGVPKYDGNETYMLDGEMLTRATETPPGAPPPTASSTYYKRRIEGRFDWISRVGVGPGNYYFTVTNKDGVVSIYGQSAQARVSIPAAVGSQGIFRWNLERVVDPFGNEMKFTYQRDTEAPPTGNTEPYDQAYLAQIDYTSHPNLTAAYRVTFTRGGPGLSSSCSNRQDIVIDGRAGFQVLTRCLLKAVDVQFKDPTSGQYQIIRRYALNYSAVGAPGFERGHFGKTLLTSIDTRGLNATNPLDTHNFQYFSTPETPPPSEGRGTVGALGPPIAWADVKTANNQPRVADGLSRSKDETSTTGIGGGLGTPAANIGIDIGSTISRQDTTWRIIETTGDGVPDGVAMDGLVNIASLIGTDRLTPGALRGQFSPLQTKNFDFGPPNPLFGQLRIPVARSEREVMNASAGIRGFFSVGANTDLSNMARDKTGFVDMNGDGYLDHVSTDDNGMFVRLNDRKNGFLPSAPWPNYSLNTKTCSLTRPLDRLLDSVTRWTSTAIGVVDVLGDVVTGAVGTIGDSLGDVVTTFYLNNQPVWERTISPGDAPCSPGPNNSCSGGLTINVQAGDRIYTRARALHAAGVFVDWDPEFVYRSVGGVTLTAAQKALREPYGPPIYRFKQSDDFRLVGTAMVPWTASAGGIVAVKGVVTKAPTSDDIQIRVVRRPFDSPETVVLAQSLPAASTSTTAVVANNITIGLGEQLTFEILSDSPIDPDLVKWQPIVTYQNFCRTLPGSTTQVCKSVNCVEDPENPRVASCSLVDDPVPGVPVPTVILRQQPNVKFPLFKFQPGSATQSFVTSSAGPVSIAGTVSKSAATSGRVVVEVQGVNKLFAKKVFQANETGSASMAVTTPSLPSGSQIFFTIYSDAPVGTAVSWTPAIGGIAQPVNRNARATGAVVDSEGLGVDDAMSGGYHAWSFGEWDSAVPFDESKIPFNPAATSHPFSRMLAVPLAAGASPPDGTLAFPNPLDVLAAIPGGKYVGIAAGTAVDVGTGVAKTFASGAAKGWRFIGQLGGAIYNAIFCGTTKAIRVTSSDNHGLGIGAGVSYGRNQGTAISVIDLIDMNGDRYPDAVTSAGILFNTGAGFETSLTPMPLPLGQIRSIRHRSVSLSGSADSLMNLTDGAGNSAGFVGGSIGLSYGKSVTDTDLLDINGDGLPDRVQADPSTGSVNVYLNFGRRFGSKMVWSGAQWDNGPGPTTVLSQLFQAFNNDLDPDAIRVEETANNQGGLSTPGGLPGSFAAGATNTLVRQLVGMVDINGDGLPDQVMKLPGDETMKVKINLGDRFSAEQVIPLTAWPPGIGEPPGGLSGVGLGPADGLGFTLGSGSHWNASGNVPLGAGPTASVSHGNATSNMADSLSFDDIDGDGQLDHVIKVDGNATVFARLNQTGKTNLLKKVIRPIGSEINLEYKRQGNAVESTPPVANKPDMPGNRWALASVTVSDGRDPLGQTGVYTDVISYDVYGQAGVPSGFYDRVERENYGYSHVVVTHGITGNPARGDLSRVERFYFARDYYRKGLLMAEFEEDRDGNIIRGTSVTYATPPALSERTGSFFPKEVDRYSLFYEGSTRNALAESSPLTHSPAKYHHQTRTFDDQGNLVGLLDRGDEQIQTDDVVYQIGYLKEAGTHITRANSVEAFSAAGPSLRKRTATFDAGKGSLRTLTTFVTGGFDPQTGAARSQAQSTSTLVHDPFGNLQQATDPSNHILKYTYDATTQTYPARVDDLSFTFFSTADYDLRFGLPKKTTDVNLQVQTFEYDQFGRLFRVYGPDDQGTAEATIEMTYSQLNFPVSASTKHKDVQHPGDPIQTVTFVDGLRRVIQTKKDIDYDLHADGRIVQTTMEVSGQVTFDSRGRVGAKGQPIVDPSPPNQFVVVPMINPTTLLYDAVGRPTNTTVPDGTGVGIQTNTHYDIVNDIGVDNLGDGRTWLLTEVKDPNGGLNTDVGRRVGYADSRGNRIAVREFNQIASSTTLTPLTTRYAYDPLDQLLTVTDAKNNPTTAAYDSVGQMISLDSRDAGLTTYRYDLAGNLGAKQTPELRPQNRFIKYLYDFNRLKTIDYPTSTDVNYFYGVAGQAGNGAGNLAGRLMKVTSDGKTEERFYDRMGNVNRTVTTLPNTAPATPATIAFTMRYTYDWLGRMQDMTFPNWMNNNFTFVSGLGEKVSYFYDRGGNIDRITGHHQTRNPQQNDHPTDFVYLEHAGYDEFEQRRSMISGNGINNQYSYDPVTRRLAGISASSRGAQEVQQGRSATPFHRLTYQYDRAGNVLGMKNNVSVQPWRNASVYVGPLDVTYGYDNLYQLRTLNGKYRPNVAYGYQYSDTFQYDEIGNIKRKAQSQDRLVWGDPNVNTTDVDPVTTQLAGSSFGHNVAGLTYTLDYQYAGPRPHATNAITETPPQPQPAAPREFTYDTNGNNTGNKFRLDTRIQTWDEESRLKEVKRNGGSLAQFRYDDAGERTKKRVGTNDTWYVNQFFVLAPNNRPTKHIFVGDTRVATKTDAIWMQTPVLHYYHPDHLGTTSYLSDKDQNLVQHERYFAFGELWRPGGEQEEGDLGGDRREWLFTGKEWDVDTGLYYFGARYFDPHTDVWQSTDPILGTYMRGAGNGGVFQAKNLGLYSYAWNNPIVLRDPDGRMLVEAGGGAPMSDKERHEYYQGLGGAYVLGIKMVLNIPIETVGTILCIFPGCNNSWAPEPTTVTEPRRSVGREAFDIAMVALPGLLGAGFRTLRAAKAARETEVFERFGSRAEAEATQAEGGLVLRPGHESQPKWIGEPGVVDPRRLGKPKNYEYRIDIEVQKGTREWVRQFEIKTNEPGRYAIPAERVPEFNRLVCSVSTCKR